MFEEFMFNGKTLIETKHFRDELYNKYGKNLDLVLEILGDGEHKNESRDKTKVNKRTKDGRWELVYAETDTDLILIHIKFIR